MNKKAILCSVLLSCGFGFAGADTDDDEQLLLRLNPDLESEAGSAVVIDYSGYKFLRLAENRIVLNGDDWSALRSKFEASVAGDSLFSIVYLGDSHIQADFGGAVLRRRMADAAHSAGRGIIIPYRLAATNQPVDYTFRTDDKYTSSKLLKLPWETDMPFTGVGIKPETPDFSTTISCDESFRSLRFFYTGARPEVKSIMTGDKEALFSVDNSEKGQLRLYMAEAVNELAISFSNIENFTFGGVELRAGNTGTLVHSIGNNGATYASYGQIENFGTELSTLDADLIIIALGTNEAFGKAGVETILHNIDALVDDIRANNASARIVMVGPAECYKKVRRYVKNKKGKRRRVSTTVVNTKVAQVRNTIKKYAEERGLAYYDHYSVAGGEGAAAKMKNAKILSKDGVHYSYDGYRLWGNLLADAILEQISDRK